MTPACHAQPVALVVDRVEESFAAVETPSGHVVDVLASVLPLGVREGDRVWMCIAPRVAAGPGAVPGAVSVSVSGPVSGPRAALGRAAGAECQQPTTETQCKKR